MDLEIDVAEMRDVADRLFAHLLESGHEVVSVSHDYYWFIQKEIVYDPLSTPSEFTVGQLSDDLMELKRFHTGESEPISYGLVWLAAIIRAIGEKVVS